MKTGARMVVAAALACACATDPAGATTTEGTPAECGNGLREAPEACDLGFANAPLGACRPDCTLAPCGDGMVQEGEACDDGRTCDIDCSEMLALDWQIPAADGIEVVDIVGADDGGLFAIGTTGSTGWLGAYAWDGRLRWRSRTPGEIPAAMIRHEAGIAVAIAIGGDPPMFAVAAFDDSGAQAWRWNGDEAGEAFVQLSRGADGDVHVLATPHGREPAQPLLLALSSVGTELWRNASEIPPSRALLLAERAEGDPVILREHDETGDGGGPWHFERRDFDRRGSSSGPVVLGITHDPVAFTTASVDPAGNLFGAGRAADSIWLASYDRTGVELWSRVESIFAVGASATDLEIDGQGSLLVAAYEDTRACGFSCGAPSQGRFSIHAADGAPRFAWVDGAPVGFARVAATPTSVYLARFSSPGRSTLLRLRPRRSR